jgi:hypothetical protein
MFYIIQKNSEEILASTAYSLNIIPQVEVLQGRPIYHMTSRGRREENIPFANMITPNFLQYIT